MNNKQKFKILLNISLCGCILFFIFSALGMYFYPGGTMWHNDLNPDATIINYYSHTLNFFSDLGKFSTKNLISMIFFTGSLSVTGITFSIYFYNFMLVFKNMSLIWQLNF